MISEVKGQGHFIISRSEKESKVVYLLVMGLGSKIPMQPSGMDPGFPKGWVGTNGNILLWSAPLKIKNLRSCGNFLAKKGGGACAPP